MKFALASYTPRQIKAITITTATLEFITDALDFILVMIMANSAEKKSLSERNKRLAKLSNTPTV